MMNKQDKKKDDRAHVVHVPVRNTEQTPSNPVLRPEVPVCFYGVLLIPLPRRSTSHLNHLSAPLSLSPQSSCLFPQHFYRTGLNCLSSYSHFSPTVCLCMNHFLLKIRRTKMKQAQM